MAINNVGEIDFEKINQSMQEVVDFFKRALENGDYNTADDVLRRVDFILGTKKDNIELTNGANTNPRVDTSPLVAANDFDLIYQRFKEEIGNLVIGDSGPRPAPAATGLVSYNDVKARMDQVSQRFFRTAEVRNKLIQMNPDQSVFRNALEQERASQVAEKKENDNTEKKFEAIVKAILIDDTVTPSINRMEEVEKFERYDKNLKNIRAKLNELKTELGKTPRDNAKIDTLKLDIQSLYSTEMEQIVAASNGGTPIDINDLIDETKVNSDESQNHVNDAINDNESKLKTILEQIRNLLNEAKKNTITPAVTYQDVDGNPQTVDFTTEEIFINMSADATDTTKDLANAYIRKAVKDAAKSLVAERDRAHNESIINQTLMDSYQKNIDIIDKENQIMSKNLGDRVAYLNQIRSDAAVATRIDQEKQRRADDVRAKFMGDREAKQKYREAYERFDNNRVSRTIHIPAIQGTTLNPPIEVTYDSLSDYPEKNDDLEFMQLESWEEKSMRSAILSAIRAHAFEITYNQLIADGRSEREARQVAETQTRLTIGTLYLQGVDFIDENNVTRTLGSGNPMLWRAVQAAVGTPRQADLLEEAARDVVRENDYVKNFNNAHKIFGDTAYILSTGGSAMMIKNNQSHPTVADRIQAITKFTNPFSVKSDGKRHILASALSSIGGLLSLPVRGFEWVIGASASLVMQVAMGEKNLSRPTPYNVGSFARAEARQEHLRAHGATAFQRSQFGAWLTARLPWRCRALNEEIIQKRIAEVDASIDDKYINGAIVQDIAKQEQVVRNQRARLGIYKEMVRKNPELYIDLYDNVQTDGGIYDAAGQLKEDVVKEIAKRIMARGVAQLDGVGDSTKAQTYAVFERDGSGVVTSKAKGRPSDKKFVQHNPYDNVGTIAEIDPNQYDRNQTFGDTLWTNAASIQNVRRAVTKLTDASLRVATAGTLPIFKRLFNKVIFKIDEHHKITSGGGDVAYERKPVFRNDYTVTGGHTETIKQSIAPEDMTIGDLTDAIFKEGAEAKFSANGVGPSGVFQPGGNELHAIDIKFPDASGVMQEHSIGVQTLKNWIERDRARGIMRSEATELYVNPSTFDRSNNLFDLIENHMPSGHEYIQWVKSQPNPSKALCDSIQGSCGYDLGEFEMSTGWGAPRIGDLTKEVSTWIPGTKRLIKVLDHYEEVPVAGLKRTIDTITGREETLGGLIGKIGKVVLLSQIFHTYKKGRKATQRSGGDRSREVYDGRNPYDHNYLLKKDDYTGPHDDIYDGR